MEWVSYQGPYHSLRSFDYIFPISPMLLDGLIQPSLWLLDAHFMVIKTIKLNNRITHCHATPPSQGVCGHHVFLGSVK